MKDLQLVSPNISIDISVCIIGSSSFLMGKEYGDVIDTYGTIIRFNRAPTKGFEKHVGSKTNIRVTNPHVFSNIKVNDPRWSDPEKTQPQYFIKNQKDTNIFHIGGPDITGWSQRNEHVHPTSKSFICDYMSIPISNLSKQPTIGLLTIKLMIVNGIIPHLYGFGIEESGASHYWEDKDPVSNCHYYPDERNRLKEWEDKGLIKIFT